MKDVYADLHMHSNLSDGVFSAQELTERAFQKNVKFISITDHDYIKLHVYKNSGVKIIPGIEFSCEYKGINVHILGYVHDVFLIKKITEIRMKNRMERAEKILRKLEKYDIHLDFNELVKINKNAKSIGRPHIARMMLEKKYISNFNEAFYKYIGDGKPCYVPKMKFSIDETVGKIHNAKGFAILAHPSEPDLKQFIDEIRDFDIDGIEVYSPKNKKNDIEFYLEYAQKNNLLITGGSDFHGDYDYCEYGLNEENFDIFYEKWRNI